MAQAKIVIDAKRKNEISYLMLLYIASLEEGIIREIQNITDGIIGKPEVLHEHPGLTRDEVFKFILKVIGDVSLVMSGNTDLDRMMSTVSHKLTYTLLKLKIASTEKKIADLARDVPHILRVLSDYNVIITREEMKQFLPTLYADAVSLVLYK